MPKFAPVLHYIAAERLDRGNRTVIGTTNVLAVLALESEPVDPRL
jgi:hypothetical protein